MGGGFLDNYGKVVVALAGILASVLLTVAIVKVVNTKVMDSVNSIEYEQQIKDAINSTPETPTT